MAVAAATHPIQGFLNAILFALIFLRQSKVTEEETLFDEEEKGGGNMKRKIFFFFGNRIEWFIED